MTQISRHAFLKKERVALDTWSFYFSTDKSINTYLPGQYFTLILPQLQNISLDNARFFTIASSPLEKNYIMITTKISTSLFKKELMNLKRGDVVILDGPQGGFYLHEEDTAEKVFLAGGIGITPFYSMITYAYKKKLSYSLTLFASFSKIEEVIFRNELEYIAQQERAIKIIYTITSLKQSYTSWQGEKGRISEALIAKYIETISKPVYYIVGSPQMVAQTEEILDKMDIPLSHIKVESFLGYNF